MEKDVMVFTNKENYEFGNNLNYRVLYFEFDLSVEIECNLISQCTKEALARKRAEGVILGRPKGSKLKTVKLAGKEKEIKDLLDKIISKSVIRRILGAHCHIALILLNIKLLNYLIKAKTNLMIFALY